MAGRGAREKGSAPSQTTRPRACLAQVFALNNFLCAAVVHRTLVLASHVARSDAGGDSIAVHHARVGAVLCGFALCNQARRAERWRFFFMKIFTPPHHDLAAQHTSVLFVAPLMIYVLWLLRVHVERRPAELVMLSSLFIAALLPCARARARARRSAFKGEVGKA